MRQKLKHRFPTNQRKAQILEVAINLSKEIGYMNVRATEIARRAGIDHSLIFYYFETLPKLKKLIMKTAIKKEILIIILQGLSTGDPVASRAPKELKERAYLTIQ